VPKWYGVVGYGETVEVAPGVWDDQITERKYYGDLVRNTRRLQESDKVNDNISVGNSISVIADAYSYEHFFAMRYISFGGVLWKVSEVEVQRPRLILSLGDVYNGPTPSATDTT